MINVEPSKVEDSQGATDLLLHRIKQWCELPDEATDGLVDALNMIRTEVIEGKEVSFHPEEVSFHITFMMYTINPDDKLNSLSPIDLLSVEQATDRLESLMGDTVECARVAEQLQSVSSDGLRLIADSVHMELGSRTIAIAGSKLMFVATDSSLDEVPGIKLN